MAFNYGVIEGGGMPGAIVFFGFLQSAIKSRQQFMKFSNCCGKPPMFPLDETREPAIGKCECGENAAFYDEVIMSRKRTQLTKNLYLDEYIPPALYELYLPKNLMGMIDERLVYSDQKLRDRYGRVTINNWFVGGNRHWSGIRTPDSRYYSRGSQHTYGRGSDKIFADAYAEEVQDDIQKNNLWQELGIYGLELRVSWVHTDVRWSYTGELLIFNK